MALPEAAQRRLTARHQARLERLASIARRVTTQAWDQLDSWDDDAIERLASIASPFTGELQARTAADAAAYMATLLETTARPVDVTVTPAWRDPFIAMRRALAQGRGFDEALEAGRARAGAVGSNAVISTNRRAAGRAGEGLVAGWRRTLSTAPCSWCQVVATRTYHSAESADFGHDRCACGVAPIPA